MRNFHLFLTFAVMGMFFPFHGMAQSTNSTEMTPQEQSHKQGDDIPLLSENVEKKLDAFQKDFSKWLVEKATWIDSFFDDRRYLAEENTTRVRLSLQAYYSDLDDFEIQPRFDLRLRLPQLERTTQLLIGVSEDEDFGDRDNPLLSRAGANEDAENENATFGIRHFLSEEEKFNAALQVGGSFDYVFGGLRLRGSTDLGSKWHTRLTNRTRYYSDDMWENITALDFETSISQKWFFRTTTGVVLADREEGVPHGQYVKFFQVLSEYQAVTYEANIFMDTEPSYTVTDYQLGVRYRQRFYRDWMVLDVQPFVTFPEVNDREANPGILAKLEVSFGYHTDKEDYKRLFKF